MNINLIISKDKKTICFCSSYQVLPIIDYFYRKTLGMENIELQNKYITAIGIEPSTTVFSSIVVYFEWFKNLP